MDFVAIGEEFSVSMFGEGVAQMADGRAWTKYENVILLPVTDKLGKLAVGVLKASLNQQYPRFETASYSVEGEYLTSISEPRGIETNCTSWREWEMLCQEQVKTPCGFRVDEVQLVAIKQEFLEKQVVLEFDLDRLPD
ncbi:hypothetical protein [Granulosicoccus antarcticus]|nr:hypothetical protein [Granulosicoccus antarcticus]